MTIFGQASANFGAPFLVRSNNHDNVMDRKSEGKKCEIKIEKCGMIFPVRSSVSYTYEFMCVVENLRLRLILTVNTAQNTERFFVFCVSIHVRF